MRERFEPRRLQRASEPEVWGRCSEPCVRVWGGADLGFAPAPCPRKFAISIFATDTHALGIGH
eukprot:365621-Chlamydomonas_euryale.AAC.6